MMNHGESVAAQSMSQKVLLIDDDLEIHELVAARLQDERIELLDAHGGSEGLRKARELEPDLILLDVDMPSPDGFEVCRRLKADLATAGIPIVFLTGASSSEEKIQGLDLGATDYVTKPFDPAELKARVRASLRTKYLLDLLNKKAQIDGLTGLWNRAYFHERLEQEISLARRQQRPVACILADADHFKSINDRFGHPFGDDALRTIASAIAEACRREDVVCRFGGEEFIILTPQTDLAGAAIHAERVRQVVRGKSLSHRGTAVPLTLSFGVAAVAARDFDSDRIEAKLIELADAALYRAKQAGRDRVEVAPEISNIPAGQSPSNSAMAAARA
jgi:two-component system, cell cycle response regulator